MKSKTKSKTKKNDEIDNSGEIESLQDEQRITKETKETEKLADLTKDPLSNYNWGEIRIKLDAIKDVREILAFLDRVLSEKAMCGDKKCPAFVLTRKIAGLNFELEKRHDIFDLKTARNKFKNKQDELKRFEDDYWEIIWESKVNAYEEIKSIGMPNENEAKDEAIYDGRSLAFLDKATEAAKAHAITGTDVPPYDKRWEAAAKKSGVLTEEAAKNNKEKIQVAKQKMESDKILEMLMSDEKVPQELRDKIKSLKTKVI